LLSQKIRPCARLLIEFAQVHYVSSRFALTLEMRRDEKILLASGQQQKISNEEQANEIESNIRF
jgi:hypothetical protein